MEKLKQLESARALAMRMRIVLVITIIGRTLSPGEAERVIDCPKAETILKG
jgi:hypothetical protein